MEACGPFGFERQPILDDNGKPLVNKHGTELWTPVYQAGRGGPAARGILRRAGRDRQPLRDLPAGGTIAGRARRRAATSGAVSQVRQVLLSPRNAGFRTFRGELQTDEDGQPLKGNWDQIVTEETWRGVKDILANPAAPPRGVTGTQAPVDATSPSAGSRGAALGWGPGVNKSGKLDLHLPGRATANSRNGAWLDALVVEHVVDRLSRDPTPWS